MAASGGAAGSRGDNMRALVDAILDLGHLPSQSGSSSTEERRLAVRLIKARKAGRLTCQQEAELHALQHSGAAQSSAAVGPGEASEALLQAELHALQHSGTAQPSAAVGSPEQETELQTLRALGQKSEELMQQLGVAAAEGDRWA